MAVDCSIDVDAQFKSAVQALATVDEPWVALSVLAGADLSEHATNRQPDGKNDDAYETGKANLHELESTVRALGLISSNDELDDIPTTSVKFLLIPYLGCRLHCAYHGEQSERLKSLEQARRALIEFFESVDRFGLLRKQDSEQYLDGTMEVAKSAQQKRDEKIARFKAEREAERKLQRIVERRKTHGADADNIDDEHLRDAALTIVHSAIRKGLNDIVSIDQELSLLQFACRERSKGRDPRVKAEAARRAAPASVIEGMPPTFKIVSKKEEIRRGVFRPSHSLPTYTVEEWGEIELANARRREEQQKEAEIVKVRQAEDEDSDEAADRETMEKRSWDDWRDEHNKGSGNTMR